MWLLVISYSSVLAPCSLTLHGCPSTGTSRGLGHDSVRHLSHALSPAIAKPRGEGDTQCSGMGRGQLCFPPAAGEPRSSAPASLSNLSGKGELCPTQGSSQLLNCCLLALVQGVGCSTWHSCTSPKIHPLSVL